MGIKLNAAKKLSIVKIGTSRCSHFGNFLMFPKENSRSFHWKLKKIKKLKLETQALNSIQGLEAPSFQARVCRRL